MVYFTGHPLEGDHTHLTLEEIVAYRDPDTAQAAGNLVGLRVGEVVASTCDYELEGIGEKMDLRGLLKTIVDQAVDIRPLLTIDEALATSQAHLGMTEGMLAAIERGDEQKPVSLAIHLSGRKLLYETGKLGVELERNRRDAYAAGGKA